MQRKNNIKLNKNYMNLIRYLLSKRKKNNENNKYIGKKR